MRGSSRQYDDRVCLISFCVYFCNFAAPGMESLKDQGSSTLDQATADCDGVADLDETWQPKRVCLSVSNHDSTSATTPDTNAVRCAELSADSRASRPLTVCLDSSTDCSRMLLSPSLACNSAVSGEGRMSTQKPICAAVHVELNDSCNANATSDADVVCRRRTLRRELSTNFQQCTTVLQVFQSILRTEEYLTLYRNPRVI